MTERDLTLLGVFMLILFFVYWLARENVEPINLFGEDDHDDAQGV